MRRAALSLVLLLAAMPAPAPARPAPARPPAVPRTLLGLATDIPGGASPAVRDRDAMDVRASGVSLFSVTVSWSECEPAPGQYRLDSVLRSVRLLRQSGATVHLDVPVVFSRTRDVPKDLASTAFDDPKLSLRLGRFFDALDTALLDASTISLGFAADSYFAEKPGELEAYRRLFDGAVEFLGKKAPSLKVGVTTAAPMESPAPEIAAALHRKSPLLLYIYAPFHRGAPYQHRPPESIDEDWRKLLETAAGRPMAFPEVSYSSAMENDSTPEKQAEFVRRLRRFVASSDGNRILFVRYATWRDEPPRAPGASPAPAPTTPIGIRRAKFFAHRGLQSSTGEPKPAWREWIRVTRQ